MDIDNSSDILYNVRLGRFLERINLTIFIFQITTNIFNSIS